VDPTVINRPRVLRSRKFVDELAPVRSPSRAISMDKEMVLREGEHLYRPFPRTSDPIGLEDQATFAGSTPVTDDDHLAERDEQVTLDTESIVSHGYSNHRGVIDYCSDPKRAERILDVFSNQDEALEDAMETLTFEEEAPVVRPRKPRAPLLVTRPPPESAHADGQPGATSPRPPLPAVSLPSRPRDTASSKNQNQSTKRKETPTATRAQVTLPVLASPPIKHVSSQVSTPPSSSQVLETGFDDAEKLCTRLGDVLNPAKQILKKYYRQGDSGQPAQLVDPNQGLLPVSRITPHELRLLTPAQRGDSEKIATSLVEVAEMCQTLRGPADIAAAKGKTKKV